MTTRKTLKTLATAMAALCCAIAPAAIAAPSDDVSVKIDTRYLETEWGVKKVYDALSRKAENACDLGNSRDSSSRKIQQDCMSDLLDDFIKSADRETLTHYHTSMTE